MGMVLTSVGKAIVTNLVTGLGGQAPSWAAWGTGAGTAAIGDTDLFTPATEARVSGTLSRQTTTVAADTYQLQAVITVAGSGKTITNVGVFDSAGSGSPPSGGNLFLHGDHTAMVLNIGESILYTLSLQFE